MRGTKPRTDSNASWFGQSAAGGEICTIQKVSAARIDIAKPMKIALRAALRP